MQFFVTLAVTIAMFLQSFFGIGTSQYDVPVDNKHGGDPFIVEDESGCYYTYTTGGGIDISRINGINDTTVIEKKTVYWSGNDGIVGDIWAPEIHKIGEKWYIVSCALFDKNAVGKGAMPYAEEYEENGDYYRYGFVLESKTYDIFGEYEFKNILAPDGLNNIDGTYLQKDGRLYYVCSAYVNIAHQCIFISEMENPYTLKTDENGKNNAVMLSEPEYGWEKTGWWVNEGPAVLYNGEDIYIVYSASGYSSGGYALGLLTFNGKNPMDNKSWSKSMIKVMGNQPKKNIWNAGHCSFVYRESGEIIMVYHATPTENFSDSSRLTYVKPVKFIFGIPVFYL